MGIAARMLARTILAATPDAGTPTGGLFVYNIGTDTIPEAKNICSEPKNSMWRKSVYLSNISALADVVRAAGFTVTELGVLVHGDIGGRLWIGDDEVNPATIDKFTANFESLDKTLARGATVFFFGCVSALGKHGSVLLKEISHLLPSHKIVGFDVVTSLKPTDIRREGGTFLGLGDHACYDPEVWTSDSRSKMNVRKPFVNRATADAPEAKVAQGGRIIKWPHDENSKTDDATKSDVLKLWKHGK